MSITLNELLQKTNSFVVGGAIRNKLLNLPIKDWDVVTPLTPTEVKKLVPIHHNLGEKFGTLVIKTSDAGFVEITTMRKDIVKGRHCGAIKLKKGEKSNIEDFKGVEFTTDIKEDVSRRDFTINTILMNADGEIIDLFDGVKDIENRVIRAVGNPVERLAEDSLRALRAIRFALIDGMVIEENLGEALKHVDLTEVSIERIMKELEIMFSINAFRTVQLLDEFNLLPKIFPEIEMHKSIEQNPLHHPEITLFNHDMLCLKFITESIQNFIDIEIDFDLCLITLFHDDGKRFTQVGTSFHNHDNIGAEEVEKIFRNFKLSNELINKAKFVIKNHMKMHNFENMRTGKRRQLFEHEHWNSLFALHIADISMRKLDLNRIEWIKQDFKNLMEVEKPLLNGHDILVFGFKGKEIGKIKDELFEMQLERIFTTKEEGIKILANMVI
jgi:tRNA nucleotidyltransferase (CCA-adding enzyme)